MKHIDDTVKILASSFMEQMTKESVYGISLLMPLHGGDPSSLIVVSNLEGTVHEKAQHLRAWADYLEESEGQDNVIRIKPESIQ